VRPGRVRYAAWWRGRLHHGHGPVHATVTTWYGQEVAVVGSIPELGSWQPAQGVRLRTDSGTYPVWSGAVDLPAGVGFEYKYVKLNPDGTVEWEQGGNRIATVDDSGGGCSQNFYDSWR